MKTPMEYYRFGVKWVAENDEPTILNEAVMADMISVVMLADMFGYTPRRVARDVVHHRQHVMYA